MILQERIDLMTRLGAYLQANGPEWQAAKLSAEHANGWFTPEFIDPATDAIAKNFLQREKLDAWVKKYHLDDNIEKKSIGIVMAGNIPLVGFHDFLCAFICGHSQRIKLSSKDTVLLKHISEVLNGFDERFAHYVEFADMLKGCDAYIATGSNNSARIFEEYFGRYPNIIRHNRTSVAVLTGDETSDELEKLSDDIHLYFGLGCRNVTKLYVPQEYDFIPLIQSWNKYDYFGDHHKYKNNFDYGLSLLLLNRVPYMTNGSTLLLENSGLFSPIAQVWYEFYDGASKPSITTGVQSEIQIIVGKEYAPFGSTQTPGLFDYADGKDTMQFLLGL